MKRIPLYLCVLLLLAIRGYAIPAVTPSVIQIDESVRVFLLSSAVSAYAFGVNSNGTLVHLYWGAPGIRLSDLAVPAEPEGLSSFDPSEMLRNEEYAGWGGRRFDEPALKITTSTGSRDLVLHYKSHRQEGDTLHVILRDISEPLEVDLGYRLDAGTGILARWSVIHNQGKSPVTIESAQSATWLLPKGTGRHLSYLSGRWAAETQLQREPIHEGLKVLESRTGRTGHNINPWFAIDDGSANENFGPVWFGALAWSGNWRISVEQTPYRQVRVTGGLNTFDFAYPLASHQTLETPVFYGGYSGTGFGEASRLLHRFERHRLIPDTDHARLRPVIYNSWEATTFSVSEKNQMELAERAARLGTELFVVDDGWFGKRNSDHAGLGDWVVNREKFPNGLTPLIAKVNSLGMDFGLWVEPEMVNRDSELYAAHPDWVMNFPGRPRSELRNQLVLNLARDEVRDHLISVLDKLVTENKIRYIKWDMNRIFSEPGWPEADLAEQKSLWVRYVENLYRIFDELRKRHPQLEIESCSGGGGRIDLGILKRVDEFWTSDNTEALDRIAIQDGFTHAYAPRLMSAWVTDVPNTNGRSTPLQFRFLVAMQGALGIGANLNKWNAEDDHLASAMIAFYKRIRSTVQDGDLYRLANLKEDGVSANQYVGSDGKQSVLFALRQAQQYGTDPPGILLRGLDPRATYRLTPMDRGKLSNQVLALSGAALMSRGLDLVLKGDYDSTAVLIERMP